MFNIKTFHSRYLGTSYSNLYLGTLILTMTYLKLNSREEDLKCLSTLYFTLWEASPTHSLKLWII